MHSPFIPRFAATSFLLLAFAVVHAQDTTPHSPCDSSTKAIAGFKVFGELLLRLTRDQMHQAADAKYSIGLKALDRGWSTADEQAFIGKFLASPQYLELQREREPYRTAIASVQANWRKTDDSRTAKDMCESTQVALRAIKNSYEINQKEQAVLKRMLEAE